LGVNGRALEKVATHSLESDNTLWLLRRLLLFFQESRMDRGIRASLSPNEARTLCRIGTDLTPRAMLSGRDVQQLMKLQLVRDAAGRLELTVSGRERYRQISGAIAPGSPPEEINAALVNFFSGRR
jgi:hypothetical protein